jgi:hypothetical protein
MHTSSKDIVSNTILTFRSLLSTSNNDVEVARKELLDAGILQILFKLLHDINVDNNPTTYSIQKYIVWIIKLLLEGDSKRLIAATSKKIGKMGIIQETLDILSRHIRNFETLKTSVKLPSIMNIDNVSGSDENELITILEIIFRIFKALLNLTVGRYLSIYKFFLSFLILIVILQ